MPRSGCRLSSVSHKRLSQYGALAFACWGAECFEMTQKPALALCLRGGPEGFLLKGFKKALADSKGSQMQGLEFSTCHQECLVSIVDVWLGLSLPPPPQRPPPGNQSPPISTTFLTSFLGISGYHRRDSPVKERQPVRAPGAS